MNCDNILKCYEANDSNVNDRFSMLPDEILILIMSKLPIKEAGRTSVVSRRWKYIWHCLPVLFFEANSAGRETIIDFLVQHQVLLGW